MKGAISDRAVLPAGRQAGVSIHLASLPSPYGIGDIGDSARSFIEALVDMHIGVWQFLPTGPTAYGDSPYQPLSAFAGNENLIGIEPLLRAGLLLADETVVLKNLPADFIDYSALIPIKNTLLARAAERFREKVSGGLKSDYEEFLHLHDRVWLDDYALYRVLKTQHGERPWPKWDEPFVHRDPQAIRNARTSSTGAIERVKIIQFLFERQWQDLRARAVENRVCLFADMPIYIALDSADAWANRELLRIDDDGRPDFVAGVPPDYFSEDGQLWGNPLYAWEHHEKTAYRWWIDRLRASAARADLVRIDHFRGFEAYWSVPADSETARIGTWEPGPGDAIFAALQDALGELPIVAENLGVITPEVEALRDQHRIPGMHVLQFAVTDSGFDFSSIGSNSVCYTGTHDNDTTIGWFHGDPDDIRTPEEIQAVQNDALRITGGTPETIHADMIRAAFSTNATIAIAPLQDYLGLGSESRMNTPGTSSNNWRWRALDTQLTDAVCDNVAAMVETAGRLPAR